MSHHQLPRGFWFRFLLIYLIGGDNFVWCCSWLGWRLKRRKITGNIDGISVHYVLSKPHSQEDEWIWEFKVWKSF